ncbi:SphA family protein [Microvirga puerhi]|uniref:Transporter n=1 Tax=Microvirga puerhi TaxID=2876078 RepID=A0ABS7VHK3_9HYPH|nr:transporter [Microvirga puerhi]MBZ6074984.1 transporter [Microvirga puerhi]
MPRLERLRYLTATGLGLTILTMIAPMDPVCATEGGASLYLPGFHGAGAALVPPPGFYFENDFYMYSGELSSGRRIQIGGAVLSDVRAEARANFVTGTWVTPLEIFGGSLAFGVSVPFGVPRVSAGVVIAAPRLERAFSFSQRDATFNLGDPIATALVGWHVGNFHWAISGSVNIPSGAYQDGQLSNLSFNRWIGDVSGSFTWLDPTLGLDISGVVGFEINGANPDTDYNSGNAFHVDLSITKNLTKEFSLGVLAGYYHQVSGDDGQGVSVGPYKGRVLAVGATAGYNFAVAGTPVTARIKVLREVDVENRPQGTIGLFTVAFPLGGSAAPAAPKPVTAKY